MDHSLARTVDPYNYEYYFNLLENVIEGKGGDDIIPAELSYGTDEPGLQKGIGQKTWGLGAAKKKIHHQQQSGDQGNITVMITICDNGSTIAPVTHLNFG
ncbi:hypothetical protein F5879DRAFT_995187 [Lentinula edodes]|nr:hypothetical protein F5879DRAFT_995187 [Lentinula edodes]